MAFGNSDGDHQMLQWTGADDGPRLMGLLHHTDAKREWAYDRESHIGKLDTALDEAKKKGWIVNSPGTTTRDRLPNDLTDCLVARDSGGTGALQFGS